MYGKLVNGKIIGAPSYIKKGNKEIFNYNNDSNSAVLIAEGYKKVIDSVAPSEMKKPRKIWNESEKEIIATWVDDYVEPTIEEQNEKIRQNREQMFGMISDRIKVDYDEAVARGSGNAEELKKAWLESKDKIRKENPYIEVDI